MLKSLVGVNKKCLEQISVVKNKHGGILMAIWNIFRSNISITQDEKIRRCNYLVILFEGGLYIREASIYLACHSLMQGSFQCL